MRDSSFENKKGILFYNFEIPYLIKDAQFPVGGATVQLQAWLKGFDKIGYPVSVITFKGAKNLLKHSNNYSYNFVESYFPDRGAKLLRWFYYRIPRLYSSIKDTNPLCVIQAVAGLETGIIGFICKLLHLPFIYRVANDVEVDSRYRERMPLYSSLAFQYGLKLAAGIICQNQYQLECLKRKYPEKAMIVLHNPIDLNNSDRRIRTRDERKYISWVGVFQKQKNLKCLLNIVQSMPDVEFRIAGMKSRTIDEETTEALKRLSECDNVVFVGYLQRKFLNEFLSKSVLLLNTSFFEGFSNTFLEAFLNGTPVCTTEKVDPDSIISRNELGAIAKSYELLEFKARELYYLNSEEYEIKSNACFSYVTSHHSPHALASQMLDFIDSL